MRRALGFVRHMASLRQPKLLSDNVAKAAIADDAEVRTHFVSAFAPVLYGHGVRVAKVDRLPACRSRLI